MIFFVIKIIIIFIKIHYKGIYQPTPNGTDIQQQVILVSTTNLNPSISFLIGTAATGFYLRWINRHYAFHKGFSNQKPDVTLLHN